VRTAIPNLSFAQGFNLLVETLIHPLWLPLRGSVALYDLRMEGGVMRAALFGLVTRAGGLGVFFVAAATTAAAANAQGRPVGSLSDPSGYTGRIRLVRLLYQPYGYRMDVPGGGDPVFLDMTAIAHTCHFGPLPDQVLGFKVEGLGRISWNNSGRTMCLTAENRKAGAVSVPRRWFGPMHPRNSRIAEQARSGPLYHADAASAGRPAW